MSKNLIVLILISFSAQIKLHAEILCEAPKLNLPRMTEALKTLPTHPRLLAFKKKVSQARPSKKIAYQNELANIFFDLQQKTLGYQAIELIFEPGEIFNTESNKGKVTLGQDLAEEIMTGKIYQNPKALMIFVMTHELSHVFQDVLEEKYGLDIDVDYYIAYHVKHLEVDAYALLILKQHNQVLPEKNDIWRLFFRLSRAMHSPYRNIHQIDFAKEQMGRCSDEMRLNYLEKFKALP